MMNEKLKWPEGRLLQGLAAVMVCAACLSLAACLNGDIKGHVRDLSSPNVLIRQEAITALQDAADNSAVPHLVLVLNDPVEDVRFMTARALGVLHDKQATEALVARLAKEDELRVRLAVIEALGKLRDRKATPDLLRILDQKGLTADERYTTIWSLGMIGDTRAEEKLGRLLASSDKYEVYNASQALRRIR
jgi:HEAT repeat protein